MCNYLALFEKLVSAISEQLNLQMNWQTGLFTYNCNDSEEIYVTGSSYDKIRSVNTVNFNTLKDKGCKIDDIVFIKPSSKKTTVQKSRFLRSEIY